MALVREEVTGAAVGGKVGAEVTGAEVGGKVGALVDKGGTGDENMGA